MSACIGLAQQDSVLPVPQQDALVIGDQSAEDLRRLTLGGPRPAALSVPPREEVLLIGQERQIGEFLDFEQLGFIFKPSTNIGRRRYGVQVHVIQATRILLALATGAVLEHHDRTVENLRQSAAQPGQKIVEPGQLLRAEQRC